MVHFLFFCLASVGLTAILVDGAVFASIRRYFAVEADRIRRRRERKNLPTWFSLYEAVHEILSCYQCCGFWSGLFCSLYLLTSQPFWNGLSADPWLLLNSFFAVLLCGFVGSLLATVYLHGIEYVFSYRVLAQRSTPPEPLQPEPTLPESALPEPETVADTTK